MLTERAHALLGLSLLIGGCLLVAAASFWSLCGPAIVAWLNS